MCVCVYNVCINWLGLRKHLHKVSYLHAPYLSLSFCVFCTHHPPQSISLSLPTPRRTPCPHLLSLSHITVQQSVTGNLKLNEIDIKFHYRLQGKNISMHVMFSI